MLTRESFEAAKGVTKSTIPLTKLWIEEASKVLSDRCSDWNQKVEQLQVVLAYACNGSALNGSPSVVIEKLIGPLNLAICHPKREVVVEASLAICSLISRHFFAKKELDQLAEACLPTALTQCSSVDPDIALAAMILSETIVEHFQNKEIYAKICRQVFFGIQSLRQQLVLFRIALQKWNRPLMLEMLDLDVTRIVFTFGDADEERRGLAWTAFKVLKKLYPKNADHILTTSLEYERCFITALQSFYDSGSKSQSSADSYRRWKPSDSKKCALLQNPTMMSISDYVTGGAVSDFRKTIGLAKQSVKTRRSAVLRSEVTDNETANLLFDMTSNPKKNISEVPRLISIACTYADTPNIRKWPSAEDIFEKLFEAYSLKNLMGAMVTFTSYCDEEKMFLNLDTLLARDQFVTFFEFVVERAGKEFMRDYAYLSFDVNAVRELIADWIDEFCYQGVFEPELPSGYSVSDGFWYTDADGLSIQIPVSQEDLVTPSDRDLFSSFFKTLREDDVGGITRLHKMLKDESFLFEGFKFEAVLMQILLHCEQEKSDGCKLAALGFIRKVCMLRASALSAYMHEVVDTVMRMVENPTSSPQIKERATSTLMMLASHLACLKMMELLETLRRMGGTRLMLANEMIIEAFHNLEEFEREEMLVQVKISKRMQCIQSMEDFERKFNKLLLIIEAAKSYPVSNDLTACPCK